MPASGEHIPCAGCGALVPDVEGPTHDYIGASPGCWAIYGEVLAREFSDERYGAVHQLTADTYAAQHPGTPSRKTRQSVAVHLMSLYLTLECGQRPEQVRTAMKQAASASREFTWLDPPASLGALTILDVHAAAGPVEHQERVRRWARSVWKAWTPHHETIRRWVKGKERT